MKYTLIIILLLGMFSCNSQVDKKVIKEKAKLVRNDNKKVADDLKDDKCNFDKILNDKRTSKLAKDIYIGNEWNLRNNNETDTILESINIKNKLLRPFYFKIITKSYKKLDKYLKSTKYFSDRLGKIGKEYVENNEEEFATNFDNPECFTEDDLKTWAKIVLIEFHLTQKNVETTKDEHLIYTYCRKLILNSENYSDKHKQTINRYTKYLKAEWGDFLKNI